MTRWLLLAASLALTACSGDDGGGDTGPGPGTDGGVASDGGAGPGGPEFEVDVVDGLNSSAVAGSFVQATADPAGRFAVAYGYIPGGGGPREIRFALTGGEGDWRTELVTVPGAMFDGGDALKGLGLAYVGDEAHLAFLGGDDDGRDNVEEPTDLLLGVRSGGQWAFRTLVDVSTEANDGDCSAYCNEGFVVGSHAALAADPDGDGFAVVYRDTHLGFARDDLAQADVEVYAEGTDVTNTVVDAERSGGSNANITYTASGDLFTAYNVESAPGGEDITGLWAAVRTGGAWRRVRVFERTTVHKIGVAAAADGTLHLAFFDPGDEDLVFATSTDNGETWTTEIVQDSGSTGLFPSLALDADGRPVISFTYCGRFGEGSCPNILGGRAEVRLARREGGAWQIHAVDDGQGFGRVGNFTSIAVAPNGKLGIAFGDDGNGDLLFAREL